MLAIGGQSLVKKRTIEQIIGETNTVDYQNMNENRDTNKQSKNRSLEDQLEDTVDLDEEGKEDFENMQRHNHVTDMKHS